MITKSPAYYVFATTTDVGKTLFSTGLAIEAAKNKFSVEFIKPIQTGSPKDCDSSFVNKYAQSPLVSTKTIFSFIPGMSPHRVKGADWSKNENIDKNVIAILNEILKKNQNKFILVEGAGGAASPTPGGNLQCALFRKLLLPVIFIADYRLGGLSSTISTIQFLQSCGYTISCVLMLAGKQENSDFLSKYYEKFFPVFCFGNLAKDQTSPLNTWFTSNQTQFAHVFTHLMKKHLKKLNSFPEKINYSRDHIWWPYTQHQNLKNPNYVDSAFGDFFSIFSHEEKIDGAKESTSKNIYDATASWWTQSLGHGHAALVQAAAHASGRYGHVMLPGNTHEPILQLTQKLLQTVGSQWAQRAFYTDNGSSAVEVALKMAFQYAFKAQKQPEKGGQLLQPIVIGLVDSYHGDNLAPTDASSPNDFKNLNHWYKPRGFWLPFPSIAMHKGKYVVFIPEEIYGQKTKNTPNIIYEDPLVSHWDDFYKPNRHQSPLYPIYKDYISSNLNHILEKHPFLGACVLEGVVQGAGGMHFVDPLFQRLLILACQERKIPVILDEIFTGFWRLGKTSAAEILNVQPDIACYGKILTGGLLPLAVTLARAEIFESFLGDDLSQALLHGHSYAGNPVCCAVAVAAIAGIAESTQYNKETHCLKPFFAENWLLELSQHPQISRVVAMGSVVALEFQSIAKEGSYFSKGAQGFVDYLKKNHIAARPLGNVAYFIFSFNVERETLSLLVEVIKNYFD